MSTPSTRSHSFGLKFVSVGVLAFGCGDGFVGLMGSEDKYYLYAFHHRNAVVQVQWRQSHHTSPITCSSLPCHTLMTRRSRCSFEWIRIVFSGEGRMFASLARHLSGRLEGSSRRCLQHRQDSLAIHSRHQSHERTPACSSTCWMKPFINCLVGGRHFGTSGRQEQDYCF